MALNIDTGMGALAPTPAEQERQYKLQIAKTNSLIGSINAKIKAASGKKGTSAAATAALKAQLKTQQGALSGLNTKLNNLYVSTGQYDKLLTGANRDAYLAVNALFKTYGLQSLAGKIYEYVKNGYSSDTISIMLQDTNEYKQRFAGNQARIKAGLPVLSPAEYLATEASYQQIMRQAGLPASFYDQPSDFATWIGNNVSPSEIQSRVDLATQATTLASPAFRQALNQMGIDDAHLTAYYLDGTKALPLIQKQAATAQIGAEAIKQGLAFDQTYAEQLATQGVNQSAAAQGYAQVASELGTMQTLGGLYGQGWTQRESEQADIEGLGSAVTKKAGLLSQERGAFSASVGAGRAGLGQSQAAR